MTNKEKPYKIPEEKLQVFEETVSPYYQKGGLAYSLALLGLSEPDSMADVQSDYGLVQLIRKGLSKHSIDSMMETMGVTATDMAKILRISDRTIRRYEDNTVLDAEQSERLIELARLYSRGAEVLGSLSRFRQWMNNPVVSLGHELPIDLTDTSVGIQLIHDTLGRIEYGIIG